MTSFEIYFLAIASNLTYSTAGMVYTVYARRFSSIWINQLKVAVTTVAFLLAMVVSGEMVSVSYSSLGFLLLSGFAGLCIGDVFLVRAFVTLGAARSLVLYSFQPLMLGLYAYFFLGQIFTANQTLAVLCMIICVFIFMLERNKQTGSWDIRSFTWAFLGISLDAFGTMLTRSAYEMDPALETFQVNFIRCIGALAGFIMISPKSYLLQAKDIMIMRKRETTLLIGSALSGGFISLSLYLAALKYAHMGTLTAISITGPIWVSLMECLYFKKFPNYFLVCAFAFFMTGFYLMMYP
ncbi:MAG TPA: DMT family transporter [Bacteriovoracaceae bacterium]|nr:DMT family transporter [Bacteriovoracaceae bacterium]